MICPECKFDNIQGDDLCQNCGHDLYSQPALAPDFIAEALAHLTAIAPEALAGSAARPLPWAAE